MQGRRSNSASSSDGPFGNESSPSYPTLEPTTTTPATGTILLSCSRRLTAVDHQEQGVHGMVAGAKAGLLEPVGYGIGPAAQGEPDAHPAAQGSHKRKYAHLID